MLWEFRKRLADFLIDPRGVRGRKDKAVGDDIRARLVGDRDVEWAWVAGHMPAGPGTVLDVGPGGSSLSLVAVQRGLSVTAVDLCQPCVRYTHPGIDHLCGDIREVSLPRQSFDVIINCSTIEHVDLAGRYGVTTAETDGDLCVMAHLRTLTRPEGMMIMTVPVGMDTVYAPFHRVYGVRRLPKLLEEWAVRTEQYWAQKQEGRWKRVERAEALRMKTNTGLYGLGLFVLRPAD